MRQVTLFLALIFVITENLFSQELTSEQIFQQTKDVIVTVNAYGFDGKKEDQASGVILKEKGIIVTNFRFFSGNDKIEIITVNDTIKEPEIIGVDIERDLMIIKLIDKEYPNVPVGNSDEIKTGQKICAMGNPLGFEKTLSEGIISGMREKVNEINRKFIQITASVSMGSNGGPVINKKGEVIGIVSTETMKGNNLNFAIPINEVFTIEQMSFNDRKKLDALNFFLQGLKFMEQGKNQESIDFMSKYMYEFPNDHRGYNYRGLAYTGRKMFKEAIKDFDKSLSLDNKFLPALSNRADAYFKMEDFKNAIKDYTLLIKKNPDDMYAYFARGVANLQIIEEWDAIDDFTVVIEHEKDNYKAYINRGIAYYKNKKYNAALEDWQMAIKINPGVKAQIQPYIDNADGHRVWGH